MLMTCSKNARSIIMIMYHCSFFLTRRQINNKHKHIALRRFLHIEAISRQKGARSRNYSLHLFRITSMVLYSEQGSTMDSTVGPTLHMPLNNLEHCICTTTMTHIQFDGDSNLLPPGYKPQSIRMSNFI